MTKDITEKTPNPTRFLGGPLRVVVTTAAALVVLFAATAASGAPARTTSSTNSKSVTGLVNEFEHISTFRGVADNNLPETLEGGLHLGVADFTLPSAKTGIKHDGYVDYGTLGAVDVIAASDGPALDRFAFVLDSPNDPTHFVVNVNLPAHSTVVNEPTGAIEISSPEGDTTLAPATAVDANGHTVHAHYQINNSKLVIEVNDAHAAFPVMVDPVSSAYWWGTQTWYSRSDVRNYASWYGIIGVASAACRDFGPLTGLCQRVVGAYTGWISNTWAYAKSTNQCLTMKMLWTGQVTGVSAYGCNWG